MFDVHSHILRSHLSTSSTMTFQHIGIVGAGGWGTALALLLHENQFPITLWGHDPREVERIAAGRENVIYLPGVPLPGAFRFTSDLAALAGCDLLVIVTPSKATRDVAARLAAVAVRADAVLLSCTKGVERGTGKRMSEIVAEFFPRHAIAALSGPSHAEEVARRTPTAVAIGAHDAAAALRLQKAFTTPFFRAYTNDDLAGVELGGALKNIFALAAGVCDGLGLGDNTKAALVTRALAEMIRLGTALGGRAETFRGLSGIGDLMVTCFSQHSRNRRVGERLGRGEPLAAITASMQMVAEGVPTTYSAQECARRLGIETPIIDQMRALLDGLISPRDALTALLSREPRPE
jgi:glycerol-3-phosphate dehydrogenase (NAD(P)+)